MAICTNDKFRIAVISRSDFRNTQVLIIRKKKIHSVKSTTNASKKHFCPNNCRQLLKGISVGHY